VLLKQFTMMWRGVRSKMFSSAAVGVDLLLLCKNMQVSVMILPCWRSFLDPEKFESSVS